jgi:hypothetical protein
MPTMLAQFRLALTIRALPGPAGPYSPLQSVYGRLKATPGRSELAVNLIGLADQDQSDGDGYHHDQRTCHETVEEIREGGGHGTTGGRGILRGLNLAS